MMAAAADTSPLGSSPVVGAVTASNNNKCHFRREVLQEMQRLLLYGRVFSWLLLGDAR